MLYVYIYIYILYIHAICIYIYIYDLLLQKVIHFMSVNFFKRDGEIRL